jgi:plasmid stabilization system protein ParE
LKHPVILTRQAEGDIAEAFDYYEAKRENLGFEFIERVEQAIEAISEHPLSHRRIIEDVRRANLEQFPYGIWYRVDPDNSIVIACLHHKRSPALAKRRAASRNPTGPSPS